MWTFSNAASVELFVNNVSAGRKNQTQYSHVEWDKISWKAGSLRAVAYNAAGTQIAEETVETTGEPAALQASFHDGVGANGLVSGCPDVALVEVAVVDSQGRTVPVTTNNVTFSLSTTGVVNYMGGGNGDPAENTNDKRFALTDG